MHCISLHKAGLNSAAHQEQGRHNKRNAVLFKAENHLSQGINFGHQGLVI